MASSYKEYFDQAQRNKGVRKKSNAQNFTKKPVVKGSTGVSTAIKKKKRSPSILMVFTTFGFCLATAGTFYFEEVEKLLSRIEIGIFTKAVAKDSGDAKTEESSSESIPKDEKPAGKDVKNVESGSSVASSEVTDIELDHFARLRERKVELDKREENLVKMEAELQQQRLEVEQKLKELEDVRRKISSVLEEKVQADDQKVENLVNFYSNMKPPQAAKIIESIDEDLAVQVITKMKKKNAADIMNLLKPEKAQSLSEKYVGYKK